jgi:hypothetical protein
MGARLLGIQTGWTIGGRKHAAAVDTVWDTAETIASGGGSRQCDNSENLQLEAAAAVVLPMNRNQWYQWQEQADT